VPVRGETAHAAPNVFFTFQKHFLVTPQDSAVSLKKFNLQKVNSNKRQNFTLTAAISLL